MGGKSFYKYFLYLTSMLLSILIFGSSYRYFLSNQESQTNSVKGTSVYLAQATCEPPTEGCGSNHYWDFDTCSCVYDGSCVEPVPGCGEDYYWDHTDCVCVPYDDGGSSCQEPAGGCGTDFEWDNSACTCVYMGNCTEPTGGCGADYYWDSVSCSCVYAGATCSEPTEGCVNNHYWDQASCSCLYDGSCGSSAGSCTNGYYDYETCSCVYDCLEPAGGCGDGYYWDANQCYCAPETGTNCYEPIGGCGDSSYWDYSTCSCVWDGSVTTCTEPSEGCGDGYYWDNYSCSCKNYSYCNPPLLGCSEDSYWDSYSCTCKNVCYPPDDGCGIDSYWDYGDCVCRSSNTCTYPTDGCGDNYYWDSYYCACKPYENVTTTISSCSPPAAGCGADSYWDYYSCNCKLYPTGYNCSEPTDGCGTGWYWEDSICGCKSDYDDETYYSSAVYSTYEYEQSTDRLSYEPPERIKCIKNLLTPTEFERLRYLIPANDSERNEVQNLGNKVKSCWDNIGNVPGQGVSGSEYTTPIEREQCLIKLLGESAYRDISQGKREPTYDEHLKFERCYGSAMGDSISYFTQGQTLPKPVVSCLKSVLKDKYEGVVSGQVDVPQDLRKKVDRCFGVDAQPFEQGRKYKVPKEIRACLLETLGETRFDEISSGSKPTMLEVQKANSCFAKLNQEQVKFLPLPAEQIPYLDEEYEVVALSNADQETKTIKDKTKGGKVTFKGKGLPNSTVNIYIYSDPIVVTTTTDENGDWVYELNQPLSGEKHIAYATVRNSDGRIVRSSVFDFTVVAAEEDLAFTLLDESESSDAKDKFIKVATMMVAGASLIVIIIGVVVYLKNAKLLKEAAKNANDGSVATSSDRQSEGGRSSGPIN